jgi:hypothetical protein
MTTARRCLVAVLLALAALAILPSASHAQCAMCQTALMNSAEGRGMSREFNRAILLMLFAPYAVVTGVGLALFRRRIAIAARQALAGTRTVRWGAVRRPWLRPR